MRPSWAILLAASISTSAASVAFYDQSRPNIPLGSSSSSSSSSAVGTLEEAQVPGENPLCYCEGDHKDDAVDIVEVNLAPNPPEAGSTLSIRGRGIVKKRIDADAYCDVTVTYGKWVRLVQQTFYICEQMANVNMTCPIEEGPMELVHEVELPREIPPGFYTAKAVCRAKDGEDGSEGEPITCITTTISFNMGSIFGKSK